MLLALDGEKGQINVKIVEINIHYWISNIDTTDKMKKSLILTNNNMVAIYIVPHYYGVFCLNNPHTKDKIEITHCVQQIKHFWATKKLIKIAAYKALFLCQFNFL